MHDIFISYSRKDAATAENLAKNLEKVGFSIWWDRQIPAGKSFDEVIEKAINNSKCVIILWSDDSVKSQWARTEASEGRRRGILVPVLIEDVEIPLAFKNIQAADLRNWDNDPTNEQFVQLINDIRLIIPKEGKPEPEKNKDVEKPRITLPKEVVKDSTQKKTKLKTPIIVLGVLVILALVTWGIFNYANKPSKETNSNETAVDFPDDPKELDFWNDMRRINSDSSYTAYQEKYPSGFYDSIAHTKLDSIKYSIAKGSSEPLDTDSDGITDADDACPNEVGPRLNNGCPWPDKDGDGVLDKDDKCPDVAGTIANKGCPEKVDDTLYNAVQNIYNGYKSAYTAKDCNTLKSLISQLEIYKNNSAPVPADKAYSVLFPQKVTNPTIGDLAKDRIQRIRTSYNKICPERVSTLEWKVKIDACHSELDNTGTKNRVTVQFWAGQSLIKSMYRNGVSENCSSPDQLFSISTKQKITHVIITTNGSDAFYIDEIYLYKGGDLMNRHGRDDGRGWCISQDSKDAKSWGNKRVDNKCYSKMKFDY